MIHIKTGYLVLIVVNLCMSFSFSLFGKDGEGRAIVVPDTARVREAGIWLVKYIVESDSFVTGSGIKVQFAKGFNEPQTINPDSMNYVYAWTSRPDVSASINSVSYVDSQLTWQWEGNTKIIRVIISGGPLFYRDTIIVSFGLSPQGKFRAPYTSFVSEILMASDTDGDGIFKELSSFPSIKIKPAPPYKIKVFAQSQHLRGQSFLVKTICFDRYNNIAIDFEGTVVFLCTDTAAQIPSSYTFTRTDSGRKVITMTLNTPGVQTINARYQDSLILPRWNVLSNPIMIYEQEPPYKIYWGDLHSHSSYSMDGYGTEPFEYALRASNLDFYALTDHCSNNYRTNDHRSDGVIEEEWNQIKQKVIQYHQPGSFVTILAHEFSAWIPYGHHNVYFDAPDEVIPNIPILRVWFYKNTLNLWQALETQLPPGVSAVTIPHHLGIDFAPVSFGGTYSNSKFRTSLEIYSVWGSSEYYDPTSALSYDNITNNLRFSVDGPHYAQEAWVAGERLGVIASSDDHTARPGINYKGLVAAYADSLTRTGIFDAIRSRRTYGTTGERILLNFSINNQPMGSNISLLQAEPISIKLFAHGTDKIEFVEVLKWDSLNGEYDLEQHPIYEIIAHLNVNSIVVDTTLIDDGFENSSVYYMRLKQTRDIYDDQWAKWREVWAWSSPIWITKETVGSVDNLALPREVYLMQNYPNPFNPLTAIQYGIPKDAYVRVEVFDLLGRKVITLVSERQKAGSHTVNLESHNLSTGVYAYRLTVGNIVMTKKLLLIR